LFDAAPDLIRMVIRDAWERSQEEDEKPAVAKKDIVNESDADEKTEDDDDADISFWKRGE